MPFPTRTELLDNAYLYKGEPFLPLEASSVPTTDPAFIYKGEPFLLAVFDSAPAATPAWRMLLVFP